MKTIEQTKPKVVVILGPTASGKTGLSIEIARKFKGEIISADSRQVYTGLDIGTGKVTKTEMKRVPHHLLDVASPKKVFTADDFMRLGRKAIDDILTRGKLPIIVGGTGFYIDTLVGRIIIPEVPPNKDLRKELEKKTAEELFGMLEKRDPRRAETIDRYNPVRLIRALEIAEALGTSPEPSSELPYDVLWIGLKPDELTLREKIHTRLLARMRRGMVAEAKRLHAHGLTYTRMDELGLEYRHLARFLRGEVTKEDMLLELEAAIVQYAKRQITYWRRNTEILWFDPKKASHVMRTVKTFITLPPQSQQR